MFPDDFLEIAGLFQLSSFTAMQTRGLSLSGVYWAHHAKDSQPKLPQTLSRGWGDQLIWTQTYEEALYKSKTSNKPLMIIHHLDECPHSQALKKVFAENKDIQKLAEQFVLLNLVYETTDKHLSPDGQYVPRIMFVDPSLTVRADITGRYSNRLYAYEPSDINLLLDNMKKARKLLKTEL